LREKLIPNAEVAVGKRCRPYYFDLTGFLEINSGGNWIGRSWRLSWGSRGGVTGTLEGRNGTFVLQHSGTMSHGVPQMTVTVVPDSGTGELVGLSGSMAIKIEDGKHFYEFEYELKQ
jgi:Protein of unknown function (DUF3224)